jgi:hypothetical protein
MELHERLCVRKHPVFFCPAVDQFEKNGPMLPGKFMRQDGFTAISCRGPSRELPGDSLEFIYVGKTKFYGSNDIGPRGDEASA